jgi:hypothetical protein
MSDAPSQAQEHDRPATVSTGEYSIGSNVLPGLSKLVEECGEVVQAVGKIMGAHGFVTHWDGSDLKERLEDEMADLWAAPATRLGEPSGQQIVDRLHG